MPARHILTYARDLQGGGVERALLRLCAGWIGAGRRVTLVIGRAAGPLTAELPAGIELVELGTGSMRALMLALPGAVRAAAPDLIFCAGNYYTAVAAWTKLRLGRGCPPIVGKMSNAVRRGDHGAVLDWGHRVWLRGHGRFLDRLVAMTPVTAAEAATATGMVGRVDAIPNPPPLRAGGDPPALPSAPFILGVGRLVRQKRWDRLIAALPALSGVPAVILGEGHDRVALARQAAELGVPLHLPGHAADPLAAMARAAVLVLPSDYEGVPGVLREALSVGTPVVTTDSSPAVHEIVSAPGLGTVVPRDDPAALVAALRQWLGPVIRPDPVPLPGADSAARYLAVFDGLVPLPPRA